MKSILHVGITEREDIELGDDRCGLVRLGWIRDVHAHCIMGNVIIPPHDFKQRSRRYYAVQEDIKHEIGSITCGIMSILNSTDFLPVIL
jgi:hypothetical protein